MKLSKEDITNCIIAGILGFMLGVWIMIFCIEMGWIK